MKKSPQLEIEDVKGILEEHGYLVTSKIGNGASAVAFCVTSQRYQTKFCAKVLIHKKPGALRTYAAEIKSLIALDHPHIIRIYETFVQDPMLFLILEYCGQGTIHKRIQSGPPLSTYQLVKYSKQILIALDYCHRSGFAHRDIKPDNVFLTSYNTIKLADFGFAKHCEEGSKINEFCGSIPFSAPEILKKNAVDPFKADIWATGVTFYYMATRSYPWDTSSEQSLIRSIINGVFHVPGRVSSEYSELITAMLRYNPSDRPNAEELLKFPIFTSPMVETSASFGLTETRQLSSQIQLITSKALRGSAESLIQQPFLRRSHHRSFTSNTFSDC